MDLRRRSAVDYTEGHAPAPGTPAWLKTRAARPGGLQPGTSEKENETPPSGAAPGLGRASQGAEKPKPKPKPKKVVKAGGLQHRKALNSQAESGQVLPSAPPVAAVEPAPLGLQQKIQPGKQAGGSAAAPQRVAERGRNAGLKVEEVVPAARKGRKRQRPPELSPSGRDAAKSFAGADGPTIAHHAQASQEKESCEDRTDGGAARCSGPTSLRPPARDPVASVPAARALKGSKAKARSKSTGQRRAGDTGGRSSTLQPAEDRRQTLPATLVPRVGESKQGAHGRAGTSKQATAAEQPMADSIPPAQPSTRQPQQARQPEAIAHASGDKSAAPAICPDHAAAPAALPTSVPHDAAPQFHAQPPAHVWRLIDAPEGWARLQSLEGNVLELTEMNAGLRASYREMREKYLQYIEEVLKEGQDDLDKQESLVRHWKAEAERQAGIAQAGGAEEFREEMRQLRADNEHLRPALTDAKEALADCRLELASQRELCGELQEALAAAQAYTSSVKTADAAMQVDLPGPQPPQPSAVERDHPCQAPVYAQDPKLALPLQHMEARPCPSCGLAYFARQPAVRDIGIAAEHAPANQKADCWAPDPVDVAEPGEVQMMEARAMCPEGAPALREASLQIYRELATVSAAADGGLEGNWRLDASCTANSFGDQEVVPAIAAPKRTESPLEAAELPQRTSEDGPDVAQVDAAVSAVGELCASLSAQPSAEPSEIDDMSLDGSEADGDAPATSTISQQALYQLTGLHATPEPHGGMVYAHGPTGLVFTIGPPAGSSTEEDSGPIASHELAFVPIHLGKAAEVLPRYLQYEIVFSADQTSTLVARLMAALGKVASHSASVTNFMAA